MQWFKNFFRRLRLLTAFHWFLSVSAVLVIVFIFQSVDSSKHFRFQTNEVEPVANGPPEHEPYFAEDDSVAQDLYAKERVLCWVMTSPPNHKRRSKAIKETWGKRCNVLVFVSTEYDEELPTVKLPLVEGRKTLWGKTKEAFRYVWKHYKDEADWFMRTDDDSYIIMENLRYVLSSYNASEPLVFGHKFKAVLKKGFIAGGSGTILSKEGMKRMVEVGLDNPAICSQSDFGADDVDIARCTENLDIKSVDSRDSHGRHRFLPMNISYFINNKEPMHNKFWLWQYLYYPIKRGIDCCSDTMIGFHYATGPDMHLYDFLIYHLKPYGIVNYRTSLQKYPAPSPDRNLTEIPIPEPSAEDDKKYEEYLKQQAVENQRIAELEAVGKLMDANETLRVAEVQRRRQNHKLT